MNPEEKWNRDRIEARSRNEAAQLQALSGNVAAAQAVKDAWAPLLPREPISVCIKLPPYYAPELLP